MADAVAIIETEQRKYPGDDRPVFIGQAPSKHGDPRYPLTGRPGRRLAELASMVPMEFYLSTVRVNILPEYAGENGQGDAFPMPEARRRALQLAPKLDKRTVVFVGRRVAEAFGCRQGWFKWDECYVDVAGHVVAIRYAAIPHPSGRNRFWNDPRNVQEARTFMSGLMKAESALPRLRMLRERARASGDARPARVTSETSLREAVGEGADHLQACHEGTDPGSHR